MGPLGHSIAALVAAAGMPVFAAALALRPGWRAGWQARLGDAPVVAPGGLWLHAASLGETRAALPLLAALRERGDAVVLTHTRASALALDVEGNAGVVDGAALAGRSLAPLDHPWCVARALRRVEPRTIVLVETELWPSWIREAAGRGVAVGVVSASISQRSYRRYRRAGRWLRPMFERLAFVAARSERDAERFRTLGARPERVRTTGDLKLDAATSAPPLPSEIGDALGKAPLLVAGSTHDGEEDAAIAALLRCRRQAVDARLAIAPRRSERCEAIERAITRAGLRTRRRSAWRSAPLEPDEVVLIDRAGELPSWYAAANVAFVGGTLAPAGGHNLYEPAQQGAFVLHGPHTSSVEEAAALLADAAAAEQVESADQLAEAAVHWLSQPARARERAARGARVLSEQRGSVERTLRWIDQNGSERRR